MAAMTSTFRAWQRLAGRPGGSRIFSAAAVLRVPYFATVLPRVVVMEPGYAEVSVPNWIMVHNHLGTVHAIAMCNAAELAMGMAMEATLATDHRWIPKAMTVQYLHKATTALRARAHLTLPDQIGDGTEVTVAVGVFDRNDTEVAHADITTWVTPVRS
ncbi:DUF4442 domain-containing protein [Mycolicibacterium sp. CH28]|uniref:hotdog fold domain-containing protein n=1 Tax=Mycolicibacterium sp. CH28 TaxID=2512237 RepID=UPI001080417D|nr:hotdog fold domain-containing protein [Mycolicibacterium sp. CH28]TGD85394.1 DUF4442 domain-containing protein [Mycolicibacterium sp. CH28]